MLRSETDKADPVINEKPTLCGDEKLACRVLR